MDQVIQFFFYTQHFWTWPAKATPDHDTASTGIMGACLYTNFSQAASLPL